MSGLSNETGGELRAENAQPFGECWISGRVAGTEFVEKRAEAPSEAQQDVYRPTSLRKSLGLLPTADLFFNKLHWSHL